MMIAPTIEQEPKRQRRTKPAIIDCDIHQAPASPTALDKYLPSRWRRYREMFGMRGHFGSVYPRAYPNAARYDSWPPSGLPAGADLDFMREQLLDEWNIQYGILNPLYGAGGQVNLEYGAALASAVNDWQIQEWTEKERRLKASLVVAYEDGDLAAAEIDRLGDHPDFVQVLLIVRTQEPLGRRKYWKLYEAAQRHNLPIGIHFGGAGGGPITGAGRPSHYFEDHAGMSQAFQSQVISLVCEGVFEQFPALKIVLIEGGFAWLPALAWRLDQTWRRLYEEVPYLTKPPSDYIRKHFWLTTQPMEEPPQRHQFTQLLEHLDLEDQILFATDYPHWDFDSPDNAFPIKLSKEQRQKFMMGNAQRLYKLT